MGGLHLGIRLTESAQIGQEGVNVLVRFDHGLGHMLYWKAALEMVTWLKARTEDPVIVRFGAIEYKVPLAVAGHLASGIYAKAKLAEEWAEKERIADDGAFLCRIGFPIGLSDNPKIKQEIGKRAAWDSTLRRQLPGEVKSQFVVGTPTIWQPPKQERPS